MPINSPMPSSLGSECRKAARILTAFVNPNQSFGPDRIIPPSVLENAKGLAVLTVAKFGLLLTARAGSGLVIARRPDGSWSAPSAIGTAGAGFGSQLGAELTDFVMILNDSNAVRTFTQVGSVTLGGNVSVAAGPVGRNFEAGGAASFNSVAGIFSYSKTKGLFAGVSLEGSVIMERKDANSKFYGGPISAEQLLSGAVQPPPDAEILIRILSSRVFSGNNSNSNQADIYNDIPQYDDRRDDFARNSRRGAAVGGDSRSESVTSGTSPVGRNRASTWDASSEDPKYWERHKADPSSTFDNIDSSNSAQFQRRHFNSTYSDTSPSSPTKGSAPQRPTAPKPNFKPVSRGTATRANQVVALYTFKATQDGDLGFKKGDIITITKRTDSKNDWWTGQVGGRTGIFPSNYVEAL